MAPTRRNSDGLLARVNFPLYSVEMITSRHCLVAGGGGSAKTGVANGFVCVLFTIICCTKQNDLSLPVSFRKSMKSTTTVSVLLRLKSFDMKLARM